MADYRSSLNILRQLGISQTPLEGRKRVIVVIDWPEQGGIRVRDARELVGADLRDLWGDVRRLSCRELFRTGARKWVGRRVVRVPIPADSPSPTTEG